MKTYRIVGWYSRDGANEHVAPFARVVEVEAPGPEDAYRLGGDALHVLDEQEALGVDFLNWFIKEVK